MTRTMRILLPRGAVAVAAPAFMFWEGIRGAPNLAKLLAHAVSNKWQLFRPDGSAVNARNAALSTASVQCEKNSNWPPKDGDDFNEFTCIARFADASGNQFHNVFGSTRGGILIRLLSAQTDGYLFDQYHVDNQKIMLAERGLLKK